jgi:small-conductance mechanosensitive channel
MATTLCLWLAAAILVSTTAQQLAAQAPESTSSSTANSPEAPATVEVQPTANDQAIARRLQRILLATGWFHEPTVRVREGVVSLHGATENEQYQQWAADLAQNTRDVVAVVNKIRVEQPAVWDLRPAWNGLNDLWRDLIYNLPFIAFSLLILLIFFGLAAATVRLLRPLLERRIPVPLLRNVIARATGLLLVLFGLYVVLRVSGLSRLALSVVGGTGILGLIIGIAFRDITENFLASILLSVQRPFRTGDLVEVTGILGYVQQLNVRTTVLMTLAGNHVQIPNATVYKSTINNYTSNPNRREDLTIGVGYDVSLPEAQELALQVLSEHPAVLEDPEPWVLVDGLGPATVDLRIYFWMDGSRHSWLKVRSSIIRLIKRAFQDRGITMPDVAREIVFPRGVPVHIINEQAETGPSKARVPSLEPEAPLLKAEAGLDTEAKQIEEQSRRSRSPEEAPELIVSKR